MRLSVLRLTSVGLSYLTSETVGGIILIFERLYTLNKI